MNEPKTAAMVDFVGVGLNSVDTLIQLPHFPKFDSKVEVISTEILPGGQVASATVACQRWGLQTRYVGKIGDDLAGQIQRDGLQHERLETHLIEVPNCSSQIAFILVDQSSGERTVLWKRDARLDLLPGELRPEWITRARLLHVDGHPSAPAALAAQWARDAGVMVTADLDNLYPGVEALLEHVDFLISSREFPERLIGIADPIESLPEIARRFGCRVTGVTLGVHGALAWNGERFHYSPAFRVDAVDTTGAGDVFHAGFAYCLLQGRSLADTLEFSCAAAALNCTAFGARGGIRPVSEITTLIREGARHPQVYDPVELRRTSEQTGTVDRERRCP
jgi:sugar/nucleoside kinase (ribokinase family)